MRTRRAWLDYLAYLALRLAVSIFHVFSINTNLRFARFLGSCWASIPPWLPLLGRPLSKHRARAEEHVALAMPNLTPPEVQRIARESMQSVAMLAMEVLFTPRLMTPWTWTRYAQPVNLPAALRVLLDRSGCILLTAHYGNWELLGYTLATWGFPIVAVMRPLDNEYLNDYLMAARERSGLRLLYKKGATQSMSDVIESGQALCFIADQNAGSKGLFVDFFGRPASTYKSIGLLAMQHKVPVVIGYARRLAGRFEFEIAVNRIIQPSEWQGRDDELRWITCEFSRAMEDFIREAPEQYLWVHRRWKSRPKDERAVAGKLAVDSGHASL